MYGATLSENEKISENNEKTLTARLKQKVKVVFVGDGNGRERHL